MEFYSKNKIEKLVHLVGFIIRSFLELNIHFINWTSSSILWSVDDNTVLPSRWLQLVWSNILPLSSGCLEDHVLNLELHFCENFKYYN